MSLPSPKTRVVVFGSFYRGFCVLKALLSNRINHRISVVGVATDRPSETFVSPHRRVWQYPHAEYEETMVRRAAEEACLPVYDGRVKTSEFYEMYEQEWKPDLCISATFGQQINERLFSLPSLGFYNLHPCLDDVWPSPYAGPNPFLLMKADGRDYAVLAMHKVDEHFDHGELVGYSERVYFPPEATVIDLHKMTSPIAAKFVVQQIFRILDEREDLGGEGNDLARVRTLCPDRKAS